MADLHNLRPAKRDFSFPDDDACRRSVTSAYTDENEEEEEMPPVKKMRHQPHEATDVVNELFSPESIHSPGPLGLNLTKSPSFLELIQKKLALAAQDKRKKATESVGCRGAMRTVERMKPSQKLQPSNFQASILRIGDWEWRSKHEGDLVAKFYFAKSKVVWEILHEGLKSKIEIKFSDISGLRISCLKDLPGTLHIMVSEEPQFFQESSPQPYKSTLWHPTTDFTGGQARNFRHVLQCDPGIMDKHIANLLSGDRRLYLLSQENNINPESPFPRTCCSVPEIPSSWSHGDSYGGGDDNLFGTEQTGESFPLHPMHMGTTAAVGVSHSGALQRALSPSSEEPSGESDQLNGNKLNWKTFFETTALVQQPSMSNSEIMNGKGNDTNNLVNCENPHSRLNYLSPPPAVIRTFPGDSMTNPQVEPRSQLSHADHPFLYPSSEEPTVLPAPLKKDVLNWRSIFETRQSSSVSNAGNMNNDSGNRWNNLINPHDLSRGAAPAIVMPGEMTAWRVPDDSWTNQQVNLWNQPSYNHGLSNQNMMEQGVSSQRDLSGSQASLQNLPRNGNLSLDRTALEQISQNLLSDDEVVVNTLGEENVLSAVNSLFCLIGQAPAPLSLSSHSQASNTLPAPPPAASPAAVEPIEVINVDTPEISRVESPGWSWKLSPEDVAWHYSLN